MRVERCSCGSDNIHLYGIELFDTFKFIFVKCDTCERRGPSSGSDKDAVKQWNTTQRSMQKEGVSYVN